MTTTTTTTTTTLKSKIQAAILGRDQRLIAAVYIHPLVPAAVWGCTEAYSVHILTHRFHDPEVNVGDGFGRVESPEAEKAANALSKAVQSLGKVGDPEWVIDPNFFTRQLYVGKKI
jgi:hypothetical protein